MGVLLRYRVGIIFEVGVGLLVGTWEQDVVGALVGIGKGLDWCLVGVGWVY